MLGILIKIGVAAFVAFAVGKWLKKAVKAITGGDEPDNIGSGNDPQVIDICPDCGEVSGPSHRCAK